MFGASGASWKCWQNLKERRGRHRDIKDGGTTQLRQHGGNRCSADADAALRRQRLGACRIAIDHRGDRQTTFAVCGQVRILHNAARADQDNRQRLSSQSGGEVRQAHEAGSIRRT
jgi:hypothetical protein